MALKGLIISQRDRLGLESARDEPVAARLARIADLAFARKVLLEACMGPQSDGQKVAAYNIHWQLQLAYKEALDGKFEYRFALPEFAEAQNRADYIDRMKLYWQAEGFTCRVGLIPKNSGLDSDETQTALIVSWRPVR